MKRFVTSALCLMLAAACASGGNQSNENKNDDSTPLPGQTQLQKYPATGQLKVMSFNVRLSSGNDGTNSWDFRKEACVACIRDQRPTVLGFQEAVYATQWLFFKEKLAADYDGFGVGRDDGVQKGECMGILYRKDEVELIDGGTFWLSASPDKPSKGWDANNMRTATWGLFKLKATGKKFCYINTHLDHKGKTARAESMKLLMKKFAELNPEGLPQVLTADFNTTAGDAIFTEMKRTMGDAREDAPQGHTDYNATYNGWGSSTSTIDHIFYSKSASVAEYHTVTESYGDAEYVSDHYPIYALIDF